MLIIKNTCFDSYTFQMYQQCLETFFWNEKTRMLSWILSSKVSMFTHPVHKKKPAGKELRLIRTHGYLGGYSAPLKCLIKFLAKDQYQARISPT